MLCTIIGMLIKVIGIVVALPNTWRQYKHWRDKESAKLWTLNNVYKWKEGKQITIPFWKRWIYKASRMPNPHLWCKRYGKSAKSDD